MMLHSRSCHLHQAPTLYRGGRGKAAAAAAAVRNSTPLRRLVQAAAAAQPPAAAAGSGKVYRLRRARVEDAPAVSQVMAEVFGSGNFAGSGIEDSAFIQELEAAYTAAVSREGDSKLAEALLNKEQAALAARAYRMTREAALLRAQLAMARNQPTVWPTEGPDQLRQLSKWRRTRKFVCLVVEEVDTEDDSSSSSGSSSPGSSSSSSLSHSSGGGSSSSGSSGGGGFPGHTTISFGSFEDEFTGDMSSSSSSGRVVATATISMMQAEAALPPPFPSNAPMRAYISNMAVAPSTRRQGLAKTLCAACGRVAKAWGEPCVLLHVAADNTSAQQLYLGCGFVPVSNSQGLSGLIKGPWTQQRMAVDSAQLAAQYRQLSSGSSSAAVCGTTWRQQVQA